MLKHRIPTAIILLLIAYVILCFTPTIVFNIACWLLCLIAIYEFSEMYRFSLMQQLSLMLFASLCVIGIANIHYDLSQLIRISAVAIWCFVIPLILIFLPRHFSKSVVCAISIFLFVPAYYALSMLHAVFGPWQLLSIMAVAWIADSGAYVTGRLFGKHKLAPKISPNKSIEGAIGGLIFVIIYLSILHHYNLAYYLPSQAITYKFAFILTIASILGDLFESWLKRVAKVKDSGNLLPGHGGVFDRIDGLIAVLTIAFAMIRGML